jgi:hypothetical protein
MLGFVLADGWNVGVRKLTTNLHLTQPTRYISPGYALAI